MTAQSEVRVTRSPHRRDRVHLAGMMPERDWTAEWGGVGDGRGLRLEAAPELPADPRRVPLDLEIVVPVYNEAAHIVEQITELRRFLNECFPFRTVVTVVDNASTDDTYALASQMAAATPGVAVMHLDRKGRGLALRSAWSTTSAPVVAYMDVDLSTSLSALLPLVAPLISGHGDLAIGSRLARGAQVVRGPKRELISRTYNLLLRLCLRGRFSDAQCGFKAIRSDVARQLLPLIEDNEWFFDTELLITAERLGMRISEVAVDWVDDPDSRVQIVDTAISDLRGVWRMSHGVARRLARSATTGADTTQEEVTAEPLLRFAGVGVISTLGYLSLLLGLRPVVGIVGANTIALALCTLLNTAVHKELTHTMHGFSAKTRFSVVVSGLYLISLALTTVALLGAHVLLPGSLALALCAVTVANAIGSVIRFAILRAWIFRPWPPVSSAT